MSVIHSPFLLLRLSFSVCPEPPTGADEFFPILVYVTLKARAPSLYSNLQFIERFRTPSKLCGEAGYYYTNMVGVTAIPL